MSIADRTLGVVVLGFLSAIAPAFAANKATPLTDIGFHLFEEKSGWRRLSATETAARIVLSDANIEVLTAGQE